MRKHRLKLLLILVMCLLQVDVQAQDNALNLLKKLRSANTTQLIGYDYKVYLKNTKGRIEDSLAGRFYKVQDDYIDSNGTTICVKAAGYYAKLDLQERSALIFSVATLETKLGGKLDNKPVMLDVSDSIILKYGKIAVQKLSNGDDRLQILFRDLAITSITADIEPGSGKIMAMQIVTEEKDKYGDASGYSRVFMMRNFTYDFNRRIVSTERFFTKGQDKITLVNRYAKYKLNTITN